MRDKTVFVGGLVLVVVVVAALVAGCGGSRHLATATASARFAGSDACGGCHSDVAAQYAQTHHGEDFTNNPDRGNMTTGSCAPCHTVGYEEESGFVDDGSTPYLVNIGCEECHGEGSEHAASPSSSNIQGTPIAQESCWDCHVASYKQITENIPSLSITDASLYGRAPRSISVHHPQTLFLNGYYGYNMGQVEGPHMYVSNTCVTCHANPTQSAVTLGRDVDDSFHGPGDLAPDATSCVACHESEFEAQELFEDFEEEVKHRLVTIIGADPSDPNEPDETLFVSVNGTYVTDFSPGLLKDFVDAHQVDLVQETYDPDDPNVQAVKGVLHDYSYILHDASWGAHNPEFMEELLDDMEALLQ